MKIYADMHIHSRFSQATSKNLTLPNLEKWGKTKGINLLGSADFTHPLWIKELKNNLTETTKGIYSTKGGMNFILQTEISLIYTQDGRGRRVHLVVLAPSFDVVNQITEYLLTKGRVDYDGRPIFKISCDEFVYEMKKISSEIEVIPAHIWTPWFGALGSKSGFDSIKQCFKDQEKHIHAIETGLSSDPPMNWRLKELDKYQLISNSDSHSYWPWRIGREANIFDIKKLNYDSIIKSIQTGQGLKGTIEVDPNYGIYHYTGHRKCNICLSPQEAKKLNNICPVCGKPLTVGVLERVDKLATRKNNKLPKNTKPFYELMPLSELISKTYKKGINTKFVWKIYNSFLEKFKDEMNILLDAKHSELKKVDAILADTIIQNRQGKIKVKPGYDGVYGVPLIKQKVPKTNSINKKLKKQQKNLSQY
jgi:uncharacterized protein (TIGR00375 family)